MARRLSVGKEVDDMTECSICYEVFTDPRVLPCIHTFCLKCLLDYGKNKQPGDSVACPVCRKEFTIPDVGLAGTQKNFFMEKLVHVRKLSAEQEAQHIPCDACSSDEANAGETVKPASKYCAQCRQKYCEQCSLHHRRMKGCSDHTQVDIGKESESVEQISKMSLATCEQHKSKDIEVFCQECSAAICMMCFIKSHKTHERSDIFWFFARFVCFLFALFFVSYLVYDFHNTYYIEEVSDNLRGLVVTDTDKVTNFLKKTEELLPRLQKEKNDVIKHLAGIEDEINTAADKSIAAIQRDRVKLISEVGSIRLKRVKQLDIVKEEVKQHMTALESFRRYSETLLSSGTAGDVTRSANSLHDRADELMKFDVTRHVDSSLPPVNVTFTSSTLLDGNDRNLVGTVTEKCQLKQMIEMKTQITGKNSFILSHRAYS